MCVCCSSDFFSFSSPFVFNMHTRTLSLFSLRQKKRRVVLFVSIPSFLTATEEEEIKKSQKETETSEVCVVVVVVVMVVAAVCVHKWALSPFVNSLKRIRKTVVNLRHRRDGVVRRAHLREDTVEPGQRTVEVDFDPTRRRRDILPVIFGAPALDE